MLEVLLHEQISIYCKYYFSLNHLSRTTHHIFILLFHIFGCLNPDLALKAENPIEKHLADSNLFDYTKILTVAGVGMHIRPEAVNHGVHKTIIADEFYFNAWRVIHPECRLDILVHIKAHTHEAIIPMDEWQAVQAEFKRRRDLGPFGNKSLNLSAFSTKITCGCCGKHYRHSGKRNTAGEVYYIWTCQTKSQKGASACPSKNIPEKMLQNTAAKVLGLDEFDEDAFSKQIEEIIVIGDDTLTFRFYDGHEVTTKWQSTAKTDWWTDERRKLWGERHKRKDTNPNKHLFYEFTGFIKCGCCGANYRCQSGKRKDGTPTRSWYCIGPKDQCHNPGIRDETMKRLVIDVLGLDEFDEAAMDAQIESAAILDHTVTFHFRDGHTESRDFLDKRHGTPWTEERREKARESMKAAWTDKRRKAMSERIKKIRSEKKWPKP